MKTEFPDQTLRDNLHLLQDMFCRTVVECSQKNLTCRLVHTENVIEALRNNVEYEKKFISEAVYTENVDDVKLKQSSSRMNSLGYKIASKMSEFLI